ncbi:MAG: hypothetical protein IJL07_09085 [Lachnospiraceae bacterium]|nr:hypothetical protein [Lachnospiraceae bacterium]
MEMITDTIAREYQKKADALPYNGRQDIGERRKLRIELQERFGLVEVEAINILNGFHTGLYVAVAQQRYRKAEKRYGGNQN